MTIMLDISPEAERRLQRRAARAGVPFTQLLTGLVEDVAFTEPDADVQADDSPQRPGERLSDYLERIGILGAVASQPRADGKSWSEVEAACDPH